MQICKHACVIRPTYLLSWPSEDRLSSKSKLHINFYFLPPRENSVFIIKNSHLLLFKEMLSIRSETRINLINMTSGQNAVLSLLQQMVDL